ncbi:unnamed protein product [Lactuca saligna]|uniref:PXA domain-containing protein n=1 Tax=Lactuca saligna TaxID=75948 RepID=A0AA36E628_LACSI|nr:unnamed protein product [Lactuca saligna]
MNARSLVTSGKRKAKKLEKPATLPALSIFTHLSFSSHCCATSQSKIEGYDFISISRLHHLNQEKGLLISIHQLHRCCNFTFFISLLLLRILANSFLALFLDLLPSRYASDREIQQIYWSGLGAWADGVLGREVMLKLFSKERDERLIHHLMASKELHPSLISAQSEYKIMGVLLAAVLRPQEAQCPLVQYITRELLTCLIMEHVMRFASPEFLGFFSGIPKIEKLEIEGKAFHTNLYAVRCNYSGGKEGETERIIKHMINLFRLVLSVAPSPAPALPPSFSSIMQRFKSY